MYPILLNLKNKRVLVIGGGKIAERKVSRLLLAEADISLISPTITEFLQKLVEEKKIVHQKRKFKKGDLENTFLLIAATNDKGVNRQIYLEAERKKILVNAVDMPDYCNFFVPSIVDRGDLLVSISTHGKSPAFAKLLRKKLEEYLPKELSKEVRRLGELREGQKDKNPRERKETAHQEAKQILNSYFKP